MDISWLALTQDTPRRGCGAGNSGSSRPRSARASAHVQDAARLHSRQNSRIIAEGSLTRAGGTRARSWRNQSGASAALGAAWRGAANERTGGRPRRWATVVLSRQARCARARRGVARERAALERRGAAGLTPGRAPQVPPTWEAGLSKVLRTPGEAPGGNDGGSKRGRGRGARAGEARGGAGQGPPRPILPFHCQYFSPSSYQ